MAAFAQFASDLDAATQKLLARGSRLTELLKQGQFQPMPVEEQVVSIFAGVRGFLDTIQVNDVNRFEAAFLNEVRSKHTDVLEAIRKERELSKATEEKLNSILTAFVKSFA
jgi:F-type H+-transporting ATPase subunit alpha